MIYNQTILNVTDNSGALTLNCIRILNKSKKKAGKIGDLIVLSIKTLKSKQKIQRKSVYRGVITRTKKSFVRKNGINISFQDNSGVIFLHSKKSNDTYLFIVITAIFIIHFD